MAMVASYLILKVTYSLKQVLAAAVVLGGVAIALVPTLRVSHADTQDSASLQVRTTRRTAVLTLATRPPPPQAHGMSLSDTHWRLFVPQVFSTLLYLASVAPSAVSFVVKELVFTKQPGLNVFIVSFYGSLAELCFTLLLLPLSAVPDFGHVSPPAHNAACRRLPRA